MKPDAIQIGCVCLCVSDLFTWRSLLLLIVLPAHTSSCMGGLFKCICFKNRVFLYVAVWNVYTATIKKKWKSVFWLKASFSYPFFSLRKSYLFRPTVVAFTAFTDSNITERKSRLDESIFFVFSFFLNRDKKPIGWMKMYLRWLEIKHYFCD